MRHKTTHMAAIALTAGLATALIGCTSPAQNDDAPSQDVPPSVETTPGDSGDGGDTGATGATGGTDESQTDVTLEQAGKIATDEYGGTIKSIEDDNHMGEPTWEVELVDSNQGRIEVEVSKATGEIVSVEED